MLLLEQHIPCTVHSHSITILEEVCRRFYEQSNNPKVAGLLARTLSELITAKFVKFLSIISFLGPGSSLSHKVGKIPLSTYIKD